MDEGCYDGGMLETFLGTVSGAQGLSRGVCRGALMATGMFRCRSALPFGAFLAVPGVLPLFLGQEHWGSYMRLSGEAWMALQRLRDVQLRVPKIKGCPT